MDSHQHGLFTTPADRAPIEGLGGTIVRPRRTGISKLVQRASEDIDLLLGHFDRRLQDVPRHAFRTGRGG